MDEPRGFRQLFFGAILGAALGAANIATASTVGVIPGHFEVNSAGAATYTIPLAVTPGIHGMQPQLSLSYNSDRGNGLLGMGWALAGIPIIRRCASTIVEDGVTRGVELDSGDRFCLNGNKLRLISGTYGEDGATYGTEIATFVEIVSQTSGGAGVVPSSGPQWFSVTSKNAVTYEFGRAADAEIMAQGTTVARHGC